MHRGRLESGNLARVGGPGEGQEAVWCGVTSHPPASYTELMVGGGRAITS